MSGDDDAQRGHLDDALHGRPLGEDADDCAKSVARLEQENRAARALANMFFERLIEIWHTTEDTGVPAAQFCGFEDFESYGHFVNQNFIAAAEKILDAAP